MTDISYEAGLRRLRVSGPCDEAIREAICDAIVAFGTGARTLTVDLTRVTRAEKEAVAALLRSVRAIEQSGCRVSVLRVQESEVDHVLDALA